MFREFQILAKVEGKRLSSSIRYWLKLLGFDVNQSRLYQIYASVFWMFWVFAMWSYLIDQIYRATIQISPQDTTELMQAFPVIIFGLQLISLAQLLRDPPLKLDAANLAYIATSPVSRGAVTMIRFLRGMLIPVIFLPLLATLIAMFLAWKVHPQRVGMIGLQAFILTAGLVCLTGAIGWIVGLLRQNRHSVNEKRVFWLIIPLIVAASFLFPQIIFWSGRLWVSVIELGYLSSQMILLLFSILLAFALLYSVGNQAHMSFVMADSQLYARIQKLGVFGQMMAPDVIARIQSQSQLSRKQIFQTGLPTAHTANRAIIGHSYLMLKRHSPQEFISLLFRGVILASSVLLAAVSIGELAIQAWAIIFIMLLQLRPNNIIRTFREYMQQKYLRQFLPQNNLLLFALCAAIPFVITCLGMIAFLVIQPWVEPVIGAALAISGLMTISLCLALDIVRINRYTLRHLAFEYSFLISGVVIVLSGYLIGSLWAVFAVMILVNIALMYILYQSQPA